MKLRVCAKCTKDETETEFYSGKGSHCYCKPCFRAYNLEWRKKHKERLSTYQNEWRKQARKKNSSKWIAYELKGRCKQFGTTVEWFDEQFANQNGVCAICGKPETAKHQNGTVVRLSIDHNHATGKVRGLLCRLCNHALHNLDKDMNWAYKALTYLEENN